MKEQSCKMMQESPCSYIESEVEGNETKEQLILEKLDGLGDESKVDDLQVKDDDDDVLQALKQAMETEKYDRSDKITGVCNLLLTTCLSEEKIQSRMEKYKTLQNFKLVANF